MIRYVALRVLDAIPTVLLVLTLVFFALRILPGDPAQVALGEFATPDQIAALRAKMGLDVPLWQQYLTFLWSVATFDFGTSFVSSVPVRDMLADNLPYTIELTILATIFGLVMGIPLGVASARRRGTSVDFGARVFALLGYAIPDFYLGALLLIWLALDLGLFPISGGGDDFGDRLYHLVLPALALGVIKAAFMSRLTRGALLDTLGREYVRTARAKGAREPRVVYRHALRNAMLPVSNGLALSVLSTLSGAVAIELIFNRPGVGSMLVDAVATRDYPVVQAGLVVFSLFVVGVNLLTDLAQHPYRPTDQGIGVSVAEELVAKDGVLGFEPEDETAPVARKAAVAVMLEDPATLVCCVVLALLVVAALLAPTVAPYDPLAQSVLHANQSPSAAHWIGTDKFGRDILSRIIFGARTSLLLGVSAPILAGLSGTLLGVIAGYFGGWADRVIGRLIDLLLAFPALLLGILISAALGPGFWQLVATLTIAFAPRFGRIARASTLAIRNEPFIDASILAGVRHWTIIVRHLIPNIAGPIIVVLTLEVASAIRLEATLSFIGLGTQPPEPSWGNIIRDGLDNMFGSAWPVIAAGLAITVTTLAINLIGDRVRDMLDPEFRE